METLDNSPRWGPEGAVASRPTATCRPAALSSSESVQTVVRAGSSTVDDGPSRFPTHKKPMIPAGFCQFREAAPPRTPGPEPNELLWSARQAYCGNSIMEILPSKREHILPANWDTTRCRHRAALFPVSESGLPAATVCGTLRARLCSRLMELVFL
ncbi:hypothetical protein DHEL01_v212046 [Diaporthe helianthi]|uniref:Uncharacterized protein n=1 Tax=Diaporthe helianthi TaxID=158607 RepID=A0A2P5HH27_DIAHE|nr:hypothetical protein DHEL01_v212046 [Diaporthe helianthi]